MNTLIMYNYEHTDAERARIEREIRSTAAKHAGIDSERLSVQLVSCVAFKRNNEDTYFRAETVDALLDGAEFGPDRPSRKIRWWVQQSMIGLHWPPDSSRLIVRECFPKHCGQCACCSSDQNQPPCRDCAESPQ